MNIKEVKDLMREFDNSSLREFSWNNGVDALSFSKNKNQTIANSAFAGHVKTNAAAETPSNLMGAPAEPSVEPPVKAEAEGEAVTSPLVGVVYTKPAPDKSDFVQVGDQVKKGQTLLIIEAMKVMNEIPAPKNGIITQIFVKSDDVVEFGQELVKIK